MRRSMGFMGLQQTLDYPSPPPLGQSAPQCATLIKISLLGPSVIEHTVGVLFFSANTGGHIPAALFVHSICHGCNICHFNRGLSLIRGLHWVVKFFLSGLVTYQGSALGCNFFLSGLVTYQGSAQGCKHFFLSGLVTYQGSALGKNFFLSGLVTYQGSALGCNKKHFFRGLSLIRGLH